MRVTWSQRRFLVLAVGAAVISLSLVNSSVASSALSQRTQSFESHASAKSAIPENTSLTDVAFLNPSIGWGLFSVVGSVTCSNRVASTANGGSTFSTPVNVVSWRCANDAPVSSLAFDDSGDGFLYGPKLYVTHDGGVAWSSSYQPGAVLSVETFGNSIWMLETSRAALSSVSNSSRNPLRLLSSDNGGRTWSVLSTPAGAVARPANAEGTGWLIRVTKASAYLASSPLVREDGTYGDATPLWFTTDSGATWSKRTVPCSNFGADVALSVAPDGTLYDVCAVEGGMGEQPKETVRSTNEGRSWRVQSSCRFPYAGFTSCTKGSQFFGYLGAIDAVSSKTIFLVGDRSALEVSRDGGVRWSAVPPGMGNTAGGTSQVIFFSPMNGIVLGDGDQENERPTLWSTSDGGARWSTRVPVYN
jgi:photosystem II stability/assembly factor-like uncharacterized protein